VPELPEVETVRRQLAAGLEGMTFLSVEQIEPFMLRDCCPEDVLSLLPGRRIERVDRLGKFLVVVLDGDLFLTLHLGMTGQLLIDPEGPGGHTRFVFRLGSASHGVVGADDDGRSGAGRAVRLEFRDMRKFGRLHLTAGGPAPRLALLGPDAWRGEWDGAYLARRLRKREAPLKAFLLDQRHLAGIGNIYADEILWWTALSPLRAAGSLVEEQVCCLAEEIRTRLAEGVRLLGCTLSDFVDTEGRAGSFQDWLQAYGRQGLACRRCGGTMVRTVIGGRGTAFCPDCQR
jgi:formamidopyrimidine-DNA glycosylase